MSRGSPSLIALLGLLAVGGYQNRDKLAELMRGGGNGRGLSGASGSDGSGGLIDQLGQIVRGVPGRTDANGTRSGNGSVVAGLSEMIERFTDAYQGDKAQSWVGTGPNSAITPSELEAVLDEDTLADLTQKTGLSRSELLTRLADVLPEAVNQATPDGRLPVGEGARGTY